jgi:hydrogenase-4 component B
MEAYLFLAPVLLSFIIFLIPSKIRYLYALCLTLFTVAITSIPACRVLFHPGDPAFVLVNGTKSFTLTFTIDNLSAFFLLVTNFTFITGMLYSNGYLKSYQDTKSPVQFSLHYFNYNWLHISMLAVLMLRDGIPFLISWELMAVSSFMLILFEAEKRATLKTAVNYLVQMHVGLVLLLIAFLLCEAKTGTMSFDALQSYFKDNANIGLFLLFFTGFAIKAGFIPFHTWLPDAHPAAPSHVSGVMSGVMIKMGIYGIVRVLTHVQSDMYIIGLIILVISAISGLIGVMMAIVQHDLKKLLAYHSIENIGIIGMGIGLGMMGLGSNNSLLAFLGFGGGLLHILNHSLFKSLLFFSAGSVYRASHTRNIEELGGVIHKMPQTAAFFLIGSIAICGLPPLNGFISEVLIYFGFFRGMMEGSIYQSIALLLAIISLVLIGGLALFCFTKAFSVVFLGEARTEKTKNIVETEFSMLFPQYLISLLILLIGFFPLLFIQPVMSVISRQFNLILSPAMISLAQILTKISLMGGVLVIMVLFLLLIRSLITKKRTVKTGPTWGCGYTAGTFKQQYTGTSYADNFAELASPILHTQKEYKVIPPEEIFPSRRSFRTHPLDIFHSWLGKMLDLSMLVLKKLARLQTGNIQHYILYAFIFILIIFFLLYMNIL